MYILTHPSFVSIAASFVNSIVDHVQVCIEYCTSTTTHVSIWHWLREDIVVFSYIVHTTQTLDSSVARLVLTRKDKKQF